jgi:hypothetical protein
MVDSLLALFRFRYRYVHMLDSVITPTAVSHSIYDKLSDDPNLSLLVKNIDLVDLTDIVDRDTLLTFLAPDNTAWRRISFGSLEGGEIIKRHIFRGLFFLDVIANQTQLTAVNGITHGVELRGEFNERLWVGGALVYDGDTLARNGVIHYIDRVIGQPYETVPPSVSPAPTITAEPTIVHEPSKKPSAQPSSEPSKQPSSQPSSEPSKQPSKQPSAQPSFEPSNQPSSQPSSEPTLQSSSGSAIATTLASATLAVGLAQLGSFVFSLSFLSFRRLFRSLRVLVR